MKRFVAAAVTGLSMMAMAAPALADGDAKKGEKVFKRCKACHKVEDGKHAIGPSLFGIIDRPVASAEGFKKYSKAMQAYAEGDAIWDVERLDRYLTKPKKEVKGTSMAFGGLRKDSQRADLIAYLETLK